MNNKAIVRTCRDLNVYKLSFALAKEIYVLSKDFPKEETYSLTDQIRRSSRSIPVNIAEGWAKRRYENVFMKQLTDAVGSLEETRTWLDFSREFKYIGDETHIKLIDEYSKVGAMLDSLLKNWKTF